MSSTIRVKQMAHLKQKQISDKSCKAIIIDTLLEAISPLTPKELSKEIAALFHVLVSSERLNQLIDALSKERIIFINGEGCIEVSPASRTEFVAARLEETTLRNQATATWIDYIHATKETSSEIDALLSQALPVFLRSLFVKHGVSSYELLTSTNDGDSFDLKTIAHRVSQQFDQMYQEEIENVLPTIFQVVNSAEVLKYLKHSIEKAVGYLSEVISDENLVQITDALKHLTVYLDTNTIYRLLNLQGEFRYEAIKDTLDFCRKSGVKLKVSALTKKELSSRLQYDAQVLMKFPARANLSKAGYKYRTSDNYVSTYWLQSGTTGISVDDFIEYYRNYDILLEAEGIEVENIEVDEQPLIDRAKSIYEKMSLRDPLHEKGDFGLWHDAYNFAYVQKMQKADARNAIDTQCLFLTTDHALTAFQREDYDAKEKPPVVITPSQLLQMFAFSKADSGYEETFIKFFASSSVGVSFEYNNNDIQEILSRIGHYNGVSSEVAERILARQIVQSRYISTTDDEEKEEIIYKTVSEELLKELDLTKEQVAALELEKNHLNDDRKAALDLLTENDELFESEKKKLQAEAEEARKRHAEEADARQQAEQDRQRVKKYSESQEQLYIDERMKAWKRKHWILLIIGVGLTLTVIVAALFLWKKLSDSGCLGLLGLLTVTLPITINGGKVLSVKSKSEARRELLNNYRERLKT